MEENPILKASLSMASDIPLYAQLTGIIKNTITSGTLRVGDLLPSEAELCDKFEISRNTVRQAIGSLEEAGFVVRKRGKGTFVADPSTRRKGVQYSFTTEISQLGKTPSSTLVDFAVITPSPKIVTLMGLEPGVKVYRFTRVRNVDGEPRHFRDVVLPRVHLSEPDARAFGDAQLLQPPLPRRRHPVFRVGHV